MATGSGGSRSAQRQPDERERVWQELATKPVYTWEDTDTGEELTEEEQRQDETARVLTIRRGGRWGWQATIRKMRTQDRLAAGR